MIITGTLPHTGARLHAMCKLEDMGVNLMQMEKRRSCRKEACWPWP